MTTASSTGRLRRLAGFAAAAVLVSFGIASIVKGVDGRSIVADSLKQEKIVGTPKMSPAAIAAEATARGVGGLSYPTCSVAGEAIVSSADARCFAEYMRVDALLATGGKTYAEMPRFASEDGKGTNVEAAATKGPDGRPMNNPARQVWVTETALSTALNTSYMADQVSLFGIAVGAAFLLLGFVLAAFSSIGLKLPARSAGTSRAAVAEPAAG